MSHSSRPRRSTSFGCGALAVLTAVVVGAVGRSMMWAGLAFVVGPIVLPGVLLPSVVSVALYGQVAPLGPLVFVPLLMVGLAFNAAMWGTLIHRIRTGSVHRRIVGLTIIEVIVVMEIVGVLATIALPDLLTAKEMARRAACDNAYVALNGEVARELAVALGREKGGTCGAQSAAEVVDCVLDRHRGARNPRNERQPGYIDPSAASSACQVQLEPQEPNRIVFLQWSNVGSRAPRTFAITIE